MSGKVLRWWFTSTQPRPLERTQAITMQCTAGAGSVRISQVDGVAADRSGHREERECAKSAARGTGGMKRRNCAPCVHLRARL